MSKETEKTNKNYYIKNVMDFLKVPEDRITDCLKEFADFLKLLRPLYELSGKISETLGEETPIEILDFVWIDDGLKNRTVKFTTKTKN